MRTPHVVIGLVVLVLLSIFMLYHSTKQPIRIIQSVDDPVIIWNIYDNSSNKRAIVQNVVISDIYDELNRSKRQTVYIANGCKRTGSTMLYNILRILMREKMDPNLYSGWDIKEHFLKQNYIVLSKLHLGCEPHTQHKYFIAHRNVSHQICSMIQMRMTTMSQAGQYCAKQWGRYKSCLESESVLYDMSFEMLMKNKTKIIEDIAVSLNISHVMNNYDYAKIERELNHLTPPLKQEKGLPQNPVTQIHPNHIHTKASCDYSAIINNVIKKNSACNAFYETVNEKLENERLVRN